MEIRSKVAHVYIDRASGAPHLKIDFYVAPDKLCEAAIEQLARAAAEMMCEEVTA